MTNAEPTWNRGALPEHEVSARKPPEQCYPKVEVYTWQEFAGFAVEMGGYGDLTMIDPYSGRRFWCPVPDQVWEQGTMAAYRYLLEQAEKHGFPDGTPIQVAPESAQPMTSQAYDRLSDPSCW